MILKSKIAALLTAMLIAVPVTLREQEEKNPKQDDEIVIPAGGPEAIARRDFMRTKLMYSQNIFEGLTTGDLDLIKTGITELELITGGEQWVQIDNDHYRRLAEDFTTSLQRMSEAVESGSIDATALRYYQMSTSCIDCHKHIRIASYDL